jgi:murein L,D-transpeptidase YcbB/YkuD
MTKTVALMTRLRRKPQPDLSVKPISATARLKCFLNQAMHELQGAAGTRVMRGQNFSGETLASYVGDGYPGTRRRFHLRIVLAAGMALGFLPFGVAAEPVRSPVAASENALRAADTPPAREDAAPVDIAVQLRAAIEQALVDKQVEAIAPALADLYAARNFEPIWLDQGKLGSNAQAAIARIKRAEEDGLDSTAYHVPSLDISSDAVEQAKADIALSKAVAAYGIQAQSGRVEPSSISALITAKPEKPSAPVVVMRVASATDSAAMLESYNPQHPEFQALKKALAEARDHTVQQPSTPVIPAGAVLRAGQNDARVPTLRHYFELAAVDNEMYDDALVSAVQNFQKAHNLKASGIIGSQTVAMLNSPRPTSKISDILVNMERWRWVPRDFGRFYITVNVPEYMGRVVKDGAVIHETRVIVGSGKNQTPLFSHLMDHIIVNPYWHVPRSIALKEMLPKLRHDPTYLARQGIEVVRVAKGRAQVLDSTMIDWSGNLGSLSFRQPPGERNALGRIKFMFPNEHSVYLHDTPGRHLFAQASRALSHGCVRVQDPFALADALQGAGAGKRLQKMVGGSERRINLAEKPNVHLVYFTVWMDGDQLVSRPDIYGHDRRLKAALNLGS